MNNLTKAREKLRFNPQYNFKKGMEDYLKVGSIKGWIKRDGKE